MNTRPHIVAGIFARGGSKGLPGKNVKPLCGKPLIGWALEAAKAVPQIDRVFVSTDDAEIARVARTFGAEVPFMRPPELARDDAPEWLAWRHAIQTLNGVPGARPVDVLVSVPTTSPLRLPCDVAACLDSLHSSDADAVITVTPSHRSPYFNMVTRGPEGETAIVIPPAGAIVRRQDAPAVYDITTVAYAVRAEFVLRADRIFAGRVRSVVVPPERAADIDTPFDFELAEFLMTKRQAGTHA